MSTCAGTNKDGSACSNPPAEGSDYCHLHQEQAGAANDVAPQDPARRFVRLLLLVLVGLYLLVAAVQCEVDHWMLG